MESEECKDTKPRVTIFQLISVPSVSVLLIASLFAAGSLTFLDPLLGELLHTLCNANRACPCDAFTQAVSHAHRQMVLPSVPLSL